MHPVTIGFDTLGPIPRKLDFSIGLPDLQEQFALVGCAEAKPSSDLQASLTVWREGETVTVKGGVSLTLSQACVRCLLESVKPFSLSFELYLKQEPRDGEKAFNEELELTDSDLLYDTFEGDNLDLSSLALEQLFAGLPQYPLCREGCLGLCPDCGSDLNGAGCGCASNKPVDPRLAVLSKLKKP